MNADVFNYLQAAKKIRDERVQAVAPAIVALNRLGEVCSARSGQSYKVRQFLYSLWNGQPTSLLEIVSFDWQIRKDLLAVMLAFGHDEFFYDAIKQEFSGRMDFEWFCDAHKDEVCK